MDQTDASSPAAAAASSSTKTSSNYHDKTVIFNGQHGSGGDFLFPTIFADTLKVWIAQFKDSLAFVIFVQIHAAVFLAWHFFKIF